jgi:hypothetical protein
MVHRVDTTIDRTDYVDKAIRQWSPERRAVHCSNCLHAQISGDAANPIASCGMGHGAVKHILRLIAPKNPAPFRDAAKCPDFSSMDDDPA